MARSFIRCCDSLVTDTFLEYKTKKLGLGNQREQYIRKCHIYSRSLYHNHLIIKLCDAYGGHGAWGMGHWALGIGQ
ncbi:hypothetical protein NIES4072_33900 [Nostoc commune NIES-4072]|uniref:Uncharacterized protein n=1 Tax=Nostoc commune NIES-4072 TaxID=2005467 RepID=A0A2R5FV54_NOSCO|nr:hypothetical protein NIES4070_56900 [Nostoc commune HK-02]GBG19721.1 hypothetical protein NIES4072_33900 [Nostoc commune NIES-4072]